MKPRRIVKAVAGALGVAAILALLAGWYALSWIDRHLTPPPPGPSAALDWRDLDAIERAAASPRPRAAPPVYPSVEYDPALLLAPPREFGPWAWWWWPGGDVSVEVLERHIADLGEMGFAGFEHEAFSVNTGAYRDPGTADRVLSVGTRGYYEKLQAALAMLEARDMRLDLGESSGWPASGPHISAARSVPDLVPAEMKVKGGRTIRESLPGPEPNAIDYMALMGELVTGWDMAGFTTEHLKIHSVVAARSVGGSRSANPFNLEDQIVLDPGSVIELTGNVEDGVLDWDAPEGEWTIIVAYQKPSASLASAFTSAYDPRGFILNHFDAEEVRRHLEFSFGEETDLDRFFGGAVRGLFIDSPEFPLNRPVTDDFFAEFEQRRGYRLEPLVPALFIEGEHHMLAHIFNVNPAPAYQLTEHDERIRHDYDLTVSDLFIERFLGELTNWAHARDMQVTAEIYGLEIDLLRALGAADVPQTEQLFAGGTDLFLKLASSAGALYGRPVIASETFVSMGRDYTMTPRRLKTLADKVLLNGVNQIHYHGVSYPWENQTYAPFAGVPWYPWSMPTPTVVPGGRMAFTFNATPNNVFWPDLRRLNDYVSRSQYLLRQGVPDHDLLVYYPMMGFPFVLEGEAFESEHLFRSYLPDSDPPSMRRLDPQAGDGERTARPDEGTTWLHRLRQLTADLDRQGVTWSWLNGHALSDSLVNPGELTASGARYKAVLIPDVEAMPEMEIRQLMELADGGTTVFFLGSTPREAPGYKDLEESDAAVVRAMDAARQHTNIKFHDAPASLLQDLRAELEQPLAFEGASPVRRVSRNLGEGRRIDFLASLSTKPTGFAARAEPGLDTWLFDAMTGQATALEWTDEGVVTINLEPFGSRFLMTGLERPEAAGGTGTSCRTMQAAERLTLGNWSLQPSGKPSVDLDVLVDWRELEEMVHHPGPADYEAAFEVPSSEGCTVLDLGLVQGAAEVFVNDQRVDRLAYHPFAADISAFVKPGANRLSVRLYPAQRNGFIGKAIEGDERYAHFKGIEDQVVAAGLIGPVTIRHKGP